MLHDESLITLTEAARLLPRMNGKRIAVSTLWRWATAGVRGVRLETRRLGRRILTSAEALERFTAALAELPPESSRPFTAPNPLLHPRGRTPAQRRQAVERAKADLIKRGMRLP